MSGCRVLVVALIGMIVFVPGTKAARPAAVQSCEIMIGQLIGSVADLSRLEVGRSDCRGSDNGACRCATNRFNEASSTEQQLIRRLVKTILRQLRLARRRCQDGTPLTLPSPADGTDWCVSRPGAAGLALVSCNRCRGRHCCMGSVHVGSAARFQCYQQFRVPVAVKGGDELEESRQDTKDDAEDAREPPEEPEKPVGRPIQ